MNNKRIGIKIYKREMHEHPGLLTQFKAECNDGLDLVIEEIDDYYLYKNESTIKQLITLLKLYEVPYSVVYYEESNANRSGDQL